MKSVSTFVVSALFSATSLAGSISFTGIQVDMNGTGFGNVLNVLSVQNKDSEYGSVLWNGVTDVLTGDAKNTSKTRTASEMLAEGITGSKFALYFNGNEPGNASSVRLRDFQMHFLADDGSLLFDALFGAEADGLVIADFGGTGQAAWLFEVSLTNEEAALFFGTGTNRVGMSINANQAIGDVAGGAENFFLGRGNDGPTGGGDPTPEPGSIAVWTIGAIAVLLRSRRRRRNEIPVQS